MTKQLVAAAPGAGQGGGLAEDGMMTVKEAAGFLRLSVPMLYVLMERGELSFGKIGRRRLIPRRAVVDLANRSIGAACH